MWNGVKKGLFLWLLLFFWQSALFCQSSSNPDPEQMTNEEIYAELIQNLEIRKANYEKKEELQNQREESLNQTEQNLNSREGFLNQKEDYLNQKEISLNVMGNYYENLKKDKNNDYLKGFLTGLGLGGSVGFVGGGFVGFKFGITINIDSIVN